MSKWRLMNRAPRNGTVIEVYRRDQGIFTAHYVAPADMIKSDDHEPRWFSTRGDDLSDSAMPTHWRPASVPPGEPTL